MTVNKISSLSIVRVVAMLSIIAGHLCGWAGINTFQLGGIGVEMFLFLSGYLYGNKKLVDSKSWLVKRFLRLMPTIWWAAAFIAIFYFIQKGFTYTFPRLLLFTFNLQGIGWIFRDLEVLTFPELAQTWFVTVIFICYLLTAILKKWGGGKSLSFTA